MIIVFILDTSSDMAKPFSNGMSRLDCAKAFIETYFSVIQYRLVCLLEVGREEK
jgi:hypothetical protein